MVPMQFVISGTFGEAAAKGTIAPSNIQMTPIYPLGPRHLAICVLAGLPMPNRVTVLQRVFHSYRDRRTGNLTMVIMPSAIFGI